MQGTRLGGFGVEVRRVRMFGVGSSLFFWIPAFAGMTGGRLAKE